MQPLAADDPRGIGPYRLLRRLGAGGMGRVYLGRSAGGRTVAVKVVHPHFAADEQFRARFRREVDAARQVGADWTAPVLDADPDASVPWVATGYVAGPPLNEAVAESGPLPGHSVRALGAGLAEALTAVHAYGLVHRDVKPSNVLLALDGPRLIDFGIARATDGTASLTASGVSIGSPGYMSPEQILGTAVTGASDVFSLGAVLAYAATAGEPFPGESSASLLYKVVHEEPELDGLAGGLRELVAACLAKDAADRPVPEEIARRLAPGQGAEGLIRTGWLPGPLVQQVSMRAVELLDMEPDGEPGAAAQASPGDGSGSGLVTMPPAEFPSQGAGGTPPGAWPAQAPPQPGGFPATGAGEPGQQARSGRSGAVLPAQPLGGFGPPDPSYGSAAPAPGPDTGPSPAARFAFSATATSAPATPADPGTRPARRGRTLSCTLVLSVAGALAVATTTAVFMGAIPGLGGNSDDTAGDPGHSQSSPAPGNGDDRPPAGDVPKGFLGTWKGEIVQDSGTPNGNATLIISQDERGRDVLGSTYDAFGLVCKGKGKLVSAGGKQLRIKERTANEGAAPLCSGATANLTLTLRKDGKLLYRSDDDRAGNPTSVLTKSAKQPPQSR